MLWGLGFIISQARAAAIGIPQQLPDQSPTICQPKSSILHEKGQNMGAFIIRIGFYLGPILVRNLQNSIGN